MEARFVDNLTDDTKAASKSVEGIGTAAEKAKKKVDSLGKKKARPVFDADNNKFLKKIRESDSKIAKFAKTKASAILTAKDNVTAFVNRALNKLNSFRGRTWTAMVKVSNSEAMRGLEGVLATSRKITGKTWSAIVKIKDYATAPLRKIRDSLFSIKTLIGGIVAGWATQQAILKPISLADQYSGAKIGFSTLLGEAQGQKMMDDLDVFAKKSPFDTSGVISNAQKMLAMGWDANSIVKDMEIIGNAAASTGNLNQGLESIVRAMAQIKTKGKLSAEELNQLAEAGISAKAMLAEELGYGTGDAGLAAFAKDQEKGLIGADRALEALLNGMKKYDGMMDSMANETAEGLMSQIQDTFQVNVLRKWGQGLQDGAKRGLGSVVKLLDGADEALGAFGETVYEVGKELSNWAADKLEKTVSRIQEITGSDAFKNASLGGKIKLLWNGAIANPLADWWDSTVIPWWEGTASPWLAKKAAGMGETIGKGLTSGLLALFGASDTLIDGAEQGASIAGSFAKGFAEGFDGSAITKAIADAIIDVWDALPWWAKGLVLGKGVTGGIGAFNSAVGGIQAFKGNAAALWGTPGTAMVTGKGLSSVLASAGYKLTGGAATSALSGGAAAAIGGGAVAGGIAGALGAGDGIIDLYQATQATGKERKDKVFQGSTKLALVGGGAAAGAKLGATVGTVAGGPIGTAAGALIGAGIGGVGAILGGDKLGKALSDSTDEGGALNNAWQATKNFFTDTIPKAYESTKKAVSEFFTQTVPEKWNEFWTGVGDFFSNTVGPALEAAGEKISVFFTETLPEKWGEFWNSVGEFFTETIPYAAGFAYAKIETFFTETLPEKWNAFWDEVGAFFTETVPAWADNIWSNHVVPFFTETLPEKWNAFWSTIGAFFTETVPTWAEGVWNNHIVPFFTETLPAKWTAFWGIIGAFFTETIPAWAESIWNGHIVPFFTESIPGFFGQVWDSVTGFFTEKLPAIGETIWGAISGFFTETIPGWINSAIDSAKSFFSGIADSFTSGYKAGGGKGGKARGGIIGGTSSMDAFARGGIVGGSTRFIRVNEESPEMIIPLSSQRRERALKLWNKTGQMLNVPGFARGGRTDGGEGFTFKRYGSEERTGGQNIQIDVGGITFEIHVHGTDAKSIAEAIKAQIADIAEDVAGVLADAFVAQFENTPVRGGAA